MRKGLVLSALLCGLAAVMAFTFRTAIARVVPIPFAAEAQTASEQTPVELDVLKLHAPPARRGRGMDALRRQRERRAAELNAALDRHIRLLSAVESNSIPEIDRARVNSILNGGD